MRLKFTYWQLGLLFPLLLCSCYGIHRSRGGGQTDIPTQRSIDATDIALPEGYAIEMVASGLTFPSGLDFDDKGNLYIVESGYSYGEVWLEPKLLRLESDGKTSTVVTGQKNGPWTGIDFYEGNFYVAEGGQAEGGKILKISIEGKISTLVKGLPSLGDHHTDGPVVRAGYIYFGQGTATNAGIVGEDNAAFGWLPRHPEFHDIPCRDVVLAGVNYESDNPLSPEKGDKTTTGAYMAFGKSSQPGQIVKGQIPCSGSIMRIPLQGGEPELVAWGLRNPYGLCFSPEGKLFVSDNSYDARGSRPVWGSGDVVWEIKEGTWYGWPDYAEAKALNSDSGFKTPGKGKVKPLLQRAPDQPPLPAAVLGVHSSACGLDFSRSQAFGHTGEAFIALFGDMAPGVGKVLSPVGFKVMRMDLKNGLVMDFAANKGRKNGPATWLKQGGLERPVAVKFNPAGDALYIADFGIMKTTKAGPEPQPKTGVIWKITKTGGKK